MDFGVSDVDRDTKSSAAVRLAVWCRGTHNDIDISETLGCLVVHALETCHC